MVKVGENPLQVWAGVITAVAAPYVTVHLSDPADDDDQPTDIVATGTGAVNDKVQVLFRPNGRAILVKG